MQLRPCDSFLVKTTGRSDAASETGHRGDGGFCQLSLGSLLWGHSSSPREKSHGELRPPANRQPSTCRPVGEPHASRFSTPSLQLGPDSELDGASGDPKPESLSDARGKAQPQKSCEIIRVHRGIETPCGAEAFRSKREQTTY